MMESNNEIQHPKNRDDDLSLLNHDAESFIDHSDSASTKRAYDSAWVVFEQYCKQHDRPALPASPETIANFIAHQGKLDPPLSLSTIRIRLAAIAFAHRNANIDNQPTKNICVIKTMRGVAQL